MKFSILPNLQKKENIEYFLALILRNEAVKAVIFQKSDSTLKYLNQGQAHFATTIEDASMEEFLNALDKAITSAESVLPQNIEAHKTLYGLKDSWVEDNKIKKDYLEKLKKAGEELSLDPIGFLVFSESIINLIQKEEGAPVTAILTEVGEKLVTVSLVKAGKVLEVRSSEIHESVPFTVDTILKHLQTPEVMPSRIIVFNGGTKDLSQQFIGHKWSKSLPFLHLPQTLSLPKDSDIKAVLLGAATQMGANLIFDHTQPIITNDNFEEVEKETVLKPDEEEAETKEETAKEPEAPLENKENLEQINQDNSLDYFGFSTTDIAKTQPPVISKAAEDIPNEVLEKETEEIPEEVKLEEETKDGLPTLGVLTAEKAKKFSLNLPKFIAPIMAMLKVNGAKDKKLILIIGSLLIAVLLIYFLFIFQTKADVTISVNPKEDSKTLSVTFAPKGSTNLTDNTIAATIIPIDETGSVTVPATGKKDVGNKAKGKVTIFNNDTDGSITLPAGTTITSSNGIKFDLDSQVKVGSASGDVFSGTKPGTADVNVTAESIGTEANLPSDTKFTVGSSKSVAAKNDNAFSGGTKKAVTVISKTDIAKAEENLPKELANKAKSDIQSKVNKGETVLPDFVSTDLASEKFSKKVDEEASNLTLNATVSFNYLSFKDSDLSDLAEKLFNDSTFSIEKSNLTTSAKDIKVLKTKDISADLTINAKLFPKLEVVDITNQIAGADVLKAKNTLSNLTNVQNVEINIHPNIPFIASKLPKNPNNIKINIVSN